VVVVSRHLRAAGAPSRPRRIDSKRDAARWASERRQALSALAERDRRARGAPHGAQLGFDRRAA
jgi:hypothetical protein